jgi:hypothetical protein
MQLNSEGKKDGRTDGRKEGRNNRHSPHKRRIFEHKMSSLQNSEINVSIRREEKEKRKGSAQRGEGAERGKENKKVRE